MTLFIAVQRLCCDAGIVGVAAFQPRRIGARRVPDDQKCAKGGQYKQQRDRETTSVGI